MTDPLRERCETLIVELGLGREEDIVDVRPLTGGVASDIAEVDLSGRKLCIKFALPKLKVEEDWQAPVHRNKAEYEWLRTAAHISPESAVKVYGRSEVEHGFAMEFITGDDVVLWKKELLEGRGSSQKAAAVGDLIGRIHHASGNPEFDNGPFQNKDDFFALRLEPYLAFTAGKHDNVAPLLNRLASELYAANQVLVHGDVSPKNILFKGRNPIILDAECATMGAAEFDIAFCLNHLVLKAQHLPSLRGDLAKTLAGFWNSYRPHVSWEDAAGLEERVCRLLPALMLARVDGKSPVEYLNAADQTKVRGSAISLLTAPELTIDALVGTLNHTWKDEIS